MDAAIQFHLHSKDRWRRASEADYSLNQTHQ
jgi:hypothetical protein